MELIITPTELIVEPPVATWREVAEVAERRRPSPRAPRSASPSTSTSDTDGQSDKAPIELILYVSSISAHSTAALRNLRRALAEFSRQRVKLTVHDLSKDPQRADRDGVHFTPTLVTKGHGPKTWIVGHLGNPQVLQALLEAALDPSE